MGDVKHTVYLLSIYTGQSTIVGSFCNTQKKQDTPLLSRAYDLVEGGRKELRAVSTATR